MQKYKIVASKSQKKYTIIVSADSEEKAKNRLHNENYSILSISKVTNKDIEGKKFIFQGEIDGKIKNGIIIGEDIFKVYVKLKNELGYNVLFLYPEGDEAHVNAEKRQEIMTQLEHGYINQQKKIKIKKNTEKVSENFYLKKQLDESHILIEKVIEKLDILFISKNNYNIDNILLHKLERIHEKLIHIKGSTNLSILKKIGEVALMKIGEIELHSLEEKNNKQSRKLLADTNALLKQIGSEKHFIESSKDFKKNIIDFIGKNGKWSVKNKKENRKKESKQILIDTQSYNFLKTILLLEKYNEKLKNNSKEIFKNSILFLNIFSHGEKKEKILLRRKVIKQNISILKAKKTGTLHSYTGTIKGYKKLIEYIFSLLSFYKKILLVCIVLYTGIFFLSLSLQVFSFSILELNSRILIYFLFIIGVFILFSLSKNIVILFLNIVFSLFLFIFSVVNF